MIVPRSALVATGGVAGAALRWVIIELVPTTDFPWGVLVANIAGSLVLGMLVGARAVTDRTQLLVGIGFCGGLTTLSSFAVDTAELFRDDRPSLAVLNLALSLVAGLIAVTVGLARPETKRRRT